MDYSQYGYAAELLKALGHPVRLCIVRNLVQQPLCNVSKMQTCLAIPQSTVSQHLGVLKSKQIIVGQRKGTEVCYTVNKQLRPLLETIIQHLEL